MGSESLKKARIFLLRNRFRKVTFAHAGSRFALVLYRIRLSVVLTAVMKSSYAIAAPGCNRSDGLIYGYDIVFKMRRINIAPASTTKS